jgi:hypothetical protein
MYKKEIKRLLKALVIKTLIELTSTKQPKIFVPTASILL